MNNITGALVCTNSVYKASVAA